MKNPEKLSVRKRRLLFIPYVKCQQLNELFTELYSEDKLITLIAKEGLIRNSKKGPQTGPYFF
ncbi:hypothetical protein CN689_28345 [Peribacillus butanolivorans]|uniref:Uncharacterized protein n=1 Tax=Peribacillus butanolivorans TaxID=421767 RepID=A0AAX0RVS2_9BACI|nr:hypothetical protein CN689_28345 [Peribacillus butanolivorans]